MQQILKRTPLSCVITLLSMAALHTVQAAEVPAGVELAAQQNIVINNGLEVA